MRESSMEREQTPGSLDQRPYFLDSVLPSVGLPDNGSYNLSEVARILTVSRASVWRLISNGHLTAVKAGITAQSNVRIYKTELIRFFEEFKTVPTDD